jgi:hypothetical protein
LEDLLASTITSLPAFHGELKLPKYKTLGGVTAHRSNQADRFCIWERRLNVNFRG